MKSVGNTKRVNGFAIGFVINILVSIKPEYRIYVPVEVFGRL